ncbi:MAG: hypothetical protein ACPGOY_04970 [Rhodospirillaceae bacterium]
MMPELLRPADPQGWFDPRDCLQGFLPDLYYPKYRNGVSGAWTVKVINMFTARGYYGDMFPMNGAIILSGPTDNQGKQSWMSMLPVELESQEIGLRAACGHTVVFGMGMGWLAANVAMRPEVERLTIVERDPSILALIGEQKVFEQLPEDVQAKVTIINADALTWKPDGAVDSLQADIWLSIVEDGKFAQARRMQDNVQADQVYVWGQEMELVRYACRRQNSDSPSLDWPLLKAIAAEEVGLPLIFPEQDDFPARVQAGAQWWVPREENWWRAEAA